MRSQLHRVRAALAVWLACAACRATDSKVWNLKQLHAEDGSHRYSGALQGDVEYFLRHGVMGLFTNVGISSSLANEAPEEIDDPATECLDVLLDLAELSADDPLVVAAQVEWFARLVVEDPARLSRERCALALGRIGLAIETGVPGKLPATPPPAGAQAVGAALASLVAAAKPWTEGATTGASEIDLVAACEVVRALVLDLNGARRALNVTADLAGRLPKRAAEPLFTLARDLERSCVRQALAAALLDADPWVRAAAVQGAVTCGGTRVLDSLLAQLERESAPEVLVRVMRVVHARGLGEGEPDEDRRAFWTRAIYRLMAAHPDPAVRVAAMQALGKISGAGIVSLREEDWQAWWKDHAPPAPRPRGEGEKSGTAGAGP